MKHKLLLWAMAAMMGTAMAAPAFMPAQFVSPGGPSSTAPTAGPVDPPLMITAPPPTSSSAAGGGAAGPCGLPNFQQGSPLIVRPNNPLCLIQPLDDSTYMLQPRNGIQIAFDYFNLSFPWMVGVAAGLAVLQGVVAGVQIMYGGSPDKVDAGKTRFMWALGGMLLLGLAGVILRALNPIFYR